MRQRVLKAGTIAFNGGGIDCRVRNLSKTGAALEVASHLGIPAEFTLLIEADQFRKPCHVVWRRLLRWMIRKQRRVRWTLSWFWKSSCSKPRESNSGHTRSRSH